MEDFALSHPGTPGFRTGHLRSALSPLHTPDDAYVSSALTAALFGEIQPKPPVRVRDGGAYCARGGEAGEAYTVCVYTIPWITRGENTAVGDLNTRLVIPRITIL